MSEPACIGMHQLFDSVDIRDHHAAKHICKDQCDVFAWCAGRTERLYNGGHSRHLLLTGTWAGRLFGRPKLGRRFVA